MAVHREEAQAALEARRELGPAYEDAIVDSLVRKIEERLDERRPAPAARRREPWSHVPLLASLGIAIPLLGIAGSTAGLGGIIVVCLAIVLVNLFYYRA